MKELNLDALAPKVQKYPQNGGPKFDFLIFFEVSPNDSEIAQIYSRDSLECTQALLCEIFSSNGRHSAENIEKMCHSWGAKNDNFSIFWKFPQMIQR